jgi:glutamate-1-semialdehyde 2,1-aminomutase
MPNGVPMSWLQNSYQPVPMFVAEGTGSRFRDVDGHEYADLNFATVCHSGNSRFRPPQQTPKRSG